MSLFSEGCTVRITKVPTKQQIMMDEVGNLSDWKMGAAEGMDTMLGKEGTVVLVDDDGDVLVAMKGYDNYFWEQKHLEVVA